MLFPGDGIAGIKRFVVDTIAAFHRRGLALSAGNRRRGHRRHERPVVSRLSKEACSLRLVGDRHPDPTVAQLEDELLDLCNCTQMGVMGLKSQTRR